MLALLLLGICLLSSYTLGLERELGLGFNHERFRYQVNRALEAVEAVLDETRHPVLPEATEHEYEDKFALVETITNSAIASYINVLEQLGTIETAFQWAQTGRVFLQFDMDVNVTFSHQAEREIVTAESEIHRETTGAGLVGRMTGETERVKVKTVVQEYHWDFHVPYQIVLTNGNEKIPLAERDDVHTVLVLRGGDSPPSRSGQAPKRPPPPIASVVHRKKVDVTWIFQMIQMDPEKIVAQFSINRLSDHCKTPARNEQIEQAFKQRNKLVEWISEIQGLWKQWNELVERLSPDMTQSPVPDHSCMDVTSPIVPLFSNSTVLPLSDIDRLLANHESTLHSSLERCAKKVPESPNLWWSSQESKLYLTLSHWKNLLNEWADTVGYVEEMLKKQLFDAIGKELSPQDLEDFMRYHTQKLFSATYAPKPFSYAVHQTNRYPDGQVALERWVQVEGTQQKDPVPTTVRQFAGSTENALLLPLNAATSVELRGTRYVHGWMLQKWGTEASVGEEHFLVARAHQFSSFVMVLGVMGGPSQFVPKHALIVQNKDEVLIPLQMSVLPSAKEFKDAIASLSPAQRAFASAFRSMQLETSVFGVCIIQVKPQLERLLNLPNGSLTKEIQLTQDLMALFTDYQIPSDLLTFDGDKRVDRIGKIAAVKGHVQSVMTVIDSAKEKQLEDEKLKAKMKEHRQFGQTAATTSTSSQGGGRLANTRSGSSEFMAASMASYSLDDIELAVDAASMDWAEEISTSEDSVDETDGSEGKNTEKIQVPQSSYGEDFTLIPNILDAILEERDKEGYLKSTIVKAGDLWTRFRQENLLEAAQKSLLRSKEIRSEKDKAMDLLMALSRSGSLPLDDSEMHVVVAVTHCFEESVLHTVIADNINPIEKMEQSWKTLAAAIHSVPELELTAPSSDPVGDESTTSQTGTIADSTSAGGKPPLYEIVMLGDSGVGKTSLAARLTNPKRPLNHDLSATMGIEFDTQLLDTEHGKVKAKIWDTAGQERFAQFLLPTYFRKAKGVILVYDITNAKSFESLSERWIAHLNDHASADDLAMLLVGSKSDLEASREVTKEEAALFCLEYGMDMLETSAKSGENVLQSFEKLIGIVHDRALAASKNHSQR